MAKKKVDRRIEDQEAHRILQNVRRSINKAAGTDPDRQFVVNRYVYQRLQGDERKPHKNLKEALYKDNPCCDGCKKKLRNLRGINIHRKDSQKTYLLQNCVLMHPRCHTELHKRGD